MLGIIGGTGIALLLEARDIKVKSIFSHLAGSENPVHDSFTESQAAKFTERSDRISDLFWYKPMRHIANTGGISRFPQYHFNMVRLETFSAKLPIACRLRK